jgi:acetyl-CoA carboxylase carboxyl transferase subunit alpha
VASEERGVAEAIARSTEAGLMLGVPNVAIVTGEGGSGGAIAIAGANRVLILEHAIYSVIAPEGANSILWRGGRTAADAAKAMKITAQDLLAMKIVDRIVPEPPGGAHSDPEAAIKAVGDALEEELAALAPLDAEGLRKQRSDRFYAIGRAGVA